MEFGAAISLLHGALTTLWLSALGIALGVPLGLFIALIRVWRTPVLSQLFSAYVSVGRATPLVTLSLLVFFGLPSLGITLDAAPGFGLVLSYNPGYQSVLKELKESTRQRLVAIQFAFPPEAIEIEIVSTEASIDRSTSAQLVALARAIRTLDASLLREVASTRLLVAAGKLVKAGLSARAAAQAAVVDALSDDPAVEQGLREILQACIPEDEPRR